MTDLDLQTNKSSCALILYLFGTKTVGNRVEDVRRYAIQTVRWRGSV